MDNARYSGTSLLFTQFNWSAVWLRGTSFVRNIAPLVVWSYSGTPIYSDPTLVYFSSGEYTTSLPSPWNDPDFVFLSPQDSFFLNATAVRLLPCDPRGSESIISTGCQGHALSLHSAMISTLAEILQLHGVYNTTWPGTGSLPEAPVLRVHTQPVGMHPAASKCPMGHFTVQQTGRSPRKW